MIYAYLRTSTDKQAANNGTDSQRLAIEQWLAGQEAEWCIDEGRTGKNTKRPAWDRLLKTVRGGDTIVVYSVTRASRSLMDLSAWVKDMHAKGVRVVSLKESVDITTATGRLIVNMLGSISEWEREIIRERQSDGIRAKIAKGAKWGAGHHPKLTPAQWAEVAAKRQGGRTIAALAGEYKLHPNGIRNGLKRLSRRP